MRKFLSMIFVVAAVLIIALLIVGAIEPKDVVVTRTVLIKGSKESVFSQMSHFKNWPNWSPWYQIDPGMKITYQGVDGQVGSSYRWVGDEKKTGEGEMTSIALNGTAMDYRIVFLQPWHTISKGVLKVEDTAGMVKATWVFSMHFNYPQNAMNIFIDMEKTLGKDIENGLNNLKTFVEAHAQGSLSAITETKFSPHNYVGVRKNMKMEEMDAFFKDNYKLLNKSFGASAIGPLSALFFNYDTVHNRADVAIVLPMAEGFVAPNDFSVFKLPATLAYTASYSGGYEGSEKYHNALAKFAADKGEEVFLKIEEYEKGPQKEADTAKWKTNIFYLLK